MKTIPLEHAEPGMVLADDVCQGKRRILLSAGQALSENLIQVLARRGISEVAVETAESAEEKGKVAPAKKGGKAATLQIRIDISDDNMLATGSLECECENNCRCSATFDQIEEALRGAGVRYGIMEMEVNRLANSTGTMGSRKAVLARGRPPEPGRQGDFEMIVQHLRGPEMVKRLREAEYAYQAHGCCRPGMRVNAGGVIARRGEGTLPRAGMDVTGNAIEIEDMLPVALRTGPYVCKDPKEDTFRSEADGIAVFLDGVLAVCPINFDARPEITLSQDRTRASLVIHPAGEGGYIPSRTDIDRLIAEKGIVFGIQPKAIDVCLARAEKGEFGRYHVIAQGEPPQHGQNGSVVFLIPIGERGSPKIGDDGKADFREVSLLAKVIPGQELARLLPPTRGKPGKDVRGKPAPARDGRDIGLPAGVNTRAKEGEEDVLVSTAEGVARFNGRIIDVTEALYLDGDVDFSTGNIRYDKSAVILGDVKSGFSVEVGGDLEVHGTVEDAEIECKGNVLVKCGFIGSGKGCIRAGGNVNLSFIRNQEIRTLDDIRIANESMSANLLARGSIHAMGRPFSLVGGQAIAGREIMVNTLGNSNGIKTFVEVGMDFTMVQEQLEIEKNIQELELSRREVVTELRKLEKTGGTGPEEQALQEKLKGMAEKLNGVLQTLEAKREKTLEVMTKGGRPCVRVREMAYPGATIKIRQRHKVFDSETRGPKSYVLNEGWIEEEEGV